MNPFDALTKLPELIDRYEAVTAELIAAKRELEALKDDRMVDWGWVCAYFGVDRKTARLMLADVKIFVHGRKIKRFRRSDIIRFTERNSVKVKDIST